MALSYFPRSMAARSVSPRLRLRSMSVPAPAPPNSQGVSAGSVVARPAPARAITPKKRKPPAPIDPVIAQINATRNRHVAQAGASAKWLASVLTALGNSSLAGTAALNAQLGAGAQAYQAAGAATVPQMAGLASGSQVPNFLPPQPALGSALGKVALTHGISADVQRQGVMNTAMGLIGSANQYASGLPSVYADKVTSYLQGLAQFNEKIRQFGVEQQTKRQQMQSQQDIAAARIKTQVDIANQSDQTRREIAAAQLKARYDLAKTGSTAGTGYGGLDANKYTKLRQQWVAKAPTMLLQKDKNGQPVYGSDVMLRTMAQAGLRPMDALSIVNSVTPLDQAHADAIYQQMQSLLGPNSGARAAAVMRKVLGWGPVQGPPAPGTAGTPKYSGYKLVPVIGYKGPTKGLKIVTMPVFGKPVKFYRVPKQVG